MKEQNSTAHHTSDFEINKLVVRRGQEFRIRVLLNHTLQCEDNLELQLSTGPKPNITNETLVNLYPREQQTGTKWSASIQEETGSEIIVAIKSPPNAIVGKYSLNVRNGNQQICNTEKSNFYLLFNPWCKEDAVFMPNEEERTEYILNDSGYVYMGDFRSIQEKPWNFGQFEKNVLNCCIFLLSRGMRKVSESGNPVMVTRAMSAMMSSQDDNGVLVGNWSGDYEGGISPYTWTGSAPILQQYHTTKQPVCFGQCWVFSGVLTTVLRALGIPARSVTTYQAAHDTEKNLTVDIYMDEKGKVSNMTNDSLWNFHVWTEAWMKRKDLPCGYDGWQVVDGTPQERSLGVYCCGPSPVIAIRKGDIFIGYDTKFIFSEVNADQITWAVKMVNGKKELKKIAVKTRNVGKRISTKAVGQDCRRDITNEYKFPEVMECTMTLDPDTYMKKVMLFGDVPAIKGTLVAEVLDSTLADSTEVFVHFKYPKISIEMPEKVKVRQPLTCTCTIQNDLGIPLTNARFSSESLSLSPRQNFKQGPVMAKETDVPPTSLSPRSTIPQE
ncbi:protein-glutamine gamma-glutamyltransferase 4-like [Rhynchocyon petersi]